jgi:hypothetical protein
MVRNMSNTEDVHKKIECLELFFDKLPENKFLQKKDRVSYREHFLCAIRDIKKYIVFLEMNKETLSHFDDIDFNSSEGKLFFNIASAFSKQEGGMNDG